MTKQLSENSQSTTSLGLMTFPLSSSSATLLTGAADGTPARNLTATGRSHVQDIVKGIIEGETRVIVSSLTMEEIFRERQIFKTKIIERYLPSML